MRHLRDNLIMVCNYIEGSFNIFAQQIAASCFKSLPRTEIMDMSIHCRTSSLTGYKLGIGNDSPMGFAYRRHNINITRNKASLVLYPIVPLGELDY